MNIDWMKKAECSKPENKGINFHPSQGESIAPAVEVCIKCLVREECLDYALAVDSTDGVWGGTSHRERRRMRRKKPIRGKERCQVCFYVKCRCAQLGRSA